MATIYSGLEGGPNVPAPFNAPAFDFDREIIEMILDRPVPPGRELAGIRFHYEIAAMGAVPTRVFAIGVTAGGPEPQEIFTPGSLDYIPNVGNPIDRQEFEQITLGPQGQKFTTCVYFSKSVLRDQILNASPLRTGVRLFEIPFNNIDKTLTAIGLNSGMLDGSFFRSEMPCPPNCGGDYK